MRQAARTAWHAQRELDDGCALLAQTLVQAKVFSAADVWQEVRLSVEANRPRAARAAAALLSPGLERSLTEVLDNPMRFLGQRQLADTFNRHELGLLALMRVAASDPEVAASQLESRWDSELPDSLTATAWAHVARQSALKQLPAAAEQARRAWQLWDRSHPVGSVPPWGDEVPAWHVRAALREGGNGAARWNLVLRAIDGMGPAQSTDSREVREARETAWAYWRARAVQALAKPGEAGDAARLSSRQALEALAAQSGFYGQLAGADLGLPLIWPIPPLALTAEERAAPNRQPGFARALKLIELGLRSEGVREWNFWLRGLSDRELLAAAQLACERQVWDRCINTSERTRSEVDLAQRFPTPFRELVVAQSQAAGLDPAVVFGLIRQESRFIADARSSVGASGLMQLMPATARWTAQKVGLPFRPEMVNDHAVNLQLGTAYLKRVLDDFDGSLAMAAAAYNAGPGRPRRWREGALLEPAAWAESIPFSETRDYVKKVLSNAVVYSKVLGQTTPPTLKARLGKSIGPRDGNAPAPNRELP